METSHFKSQARALNLHLIRIPETVSLLNISNILFLIIQYIPLLSPQAAYFSLQFSLLSLVSQIF